MLNLQDWLDEHESPQSMQSNFMYVRSENVRDLVDQIRREQISRGELIEVLLATRGLSEGVTADAILAAMLTASKEKVLVPEEPTAKMIRAGQIASREWSASDSTENGLIPIYRAMLTASKERAE